MVLRTMGSHLKVRFFNVLSPLLIPPDILSFSYIFGNSIHESTCCSIIDTHHCRLPVPAHTLHPARST